MKTDDSFFNLDLAHAMYSKSTAWFYYKEKEKPNERIIS